MSWNVRINWGQAMSDDKGVFAAFGLEKVFAALALIVVLVIAWLSLAPPSSASGLPGNDKIGHFLAYGALTFTALLALPQRFAILVLGLSLAYGGVLELAQGLMPFGRETSWLDMAANTIGAVSAFIAISVGRRLV